MNNGRSAMIDVRGLSKYYGDLAAAKDLTFSVHAGEIFGFLGPNGAGKTTTIRMLTGLLRPTRGSATVAGFDVVRESLEVKRRIGYVADPPYLYPKLTGKEFLHFIADLYSMDQADAAAQAAELLALFELDDKANELIDSYSHGMKQKLALAAALLHHPQAIFLDEPTSGLDPRSSRTVRDLLVGLARRGLTIFLNTHFLDTAEQMCDRVGILRSGELVAIGAMEDLRRQARSGDASLEDIYLDVTGGAEQRGLAAFLEGR